LADTARLVHHPETIMTEHNPYRPLDSSSTLPQAGTSGKATTALVLGVASLIAWCLPIVGLPVSITGIVFALKAQGQTGGSRAIAGLILNIIGLCLSVFNAALGAYLRIKDL
jgi:K+ transporter